jgi:hypothetical protein
MHILTNFVSVKNKKIQFSTGCTKDLFLIPVLGKTILNVNL